jgi:hypothetical protein
MAPKDWLLLKKMESFQNDIIDLFIFIEALAVNDQKLIEMTRKSFHKRKIAREKIREIRKKENIERKKNKLIA